MLYLIYFKNLLVMCENSVIHKSFLCSLYQFDKVLVDNFIEEMKFLH